MNNNKPIWKDYPLQVSGGTYVIKEYVGGSWVTRRTFHALANPRGNADVCVNNMLCNDLKTGYPSVTGVTTHSDAWRRYECQTGATTGATEAFNFCQDWSWEDWDGEQRTLSCPINGHADMRQRLFRSRFGELSENIEIKALIRPNFNYNYVDSVAANTTSGYITVTANEEFSISCDASWITGLSDARGYVGEQTFLFSIDSYTGFTDGSTTIEVTYLGYDGEYVTDELPLTQRAIIPFFNVSPTAQTISWESGTTYVNVNTNVPFAVSDNQSWIEYASMSQVGADSWNVFFNVSANTGDSREAVLTFTYQTGEAISGTTTASVRQEAASIPCNEIWYTTTGQTVVEPYASGTSIFGANIVSNVYNSKGLITFDDCVTSIGERAFYFRESLSTMIIPDSVIIIDTLGFSDCSSLYSIQFGSDLTSIRDYAFVRCTSLSSITIPDSVTSIESGAFMYCSHLSSVTIGSGVTKLDGVFQDSGLSSITIPDNVTSIAFSFRGCSKLSSVTIGSGVTSIGQETFNGCRALSSITIPDRVTSIGGGAFSGCTSLSSIIIPDSVTGISIGAFSKCTALTSVTIGSGVTTIGNYAFSGCTALLSITIPDSVSTIGEYVFRNCSSLLSATLPSGITSIARSLFSGCTSLSSVTIPNSVTYIDSSGFTSCTSLSSITIPISVSTIGNFAFRDCTSLRTINYTGTMSQWGSVNKSSNWKSNVPATVVHCSDGDVAI